MRSEILQTKKRDRKRFSVTQSPATKRVKLHKRPKKKKRRGQQPNVHLCMYNASGTKTKSKERKRERERDREKKPNIVASGKLSVNAYKNNLWFAFVIFSMSPVFLYALNIHWLGAVNLALFRFHICIACTQQWYLPFVVLVVSLILTLVFALVSNIAHTLTLSTISPEIHNI